MFLLSQLYVCVCKPCCTCEHSSNTADYVFCDKLDALHECGLQYVDAGYQSAARVWCRLESKCGSLVVIMYVLRLAVRVICFGLWLVVLVLNM